MTIYGLEKKKKKKLVRTASKLHSHHPSESLIYSMEIQSQQILSRLLTLTFTFIQNLWQASDQTS